MPTPASNRPEKRVRIEPDQTESLIVDQINHSDAPDDQIENEFGLLSLVSQIVADLTDTAVVQLTTVNDELE